MKRVKVMLMAIAVIALAAGTLAFKARYGVQFCTTAATSFVSQGLPVYTCATTLQGTVPLTCDQLANRKFAPAGAPTVTVCTTATTIDNGIITCEINDIGLPCTLTTTKLTVE